MLNLFDHKAKGVYEILTMAKTYKAFHFDINNTIIGTDSTDGDVTIEQSASEALSRSVLVNGFIAHQEQSTFYDYYKSKIPDYKRMIYDITSTFPKLVPLHQQLVGALRNGLFPSFVHFAQTYASEPGNVIVLRTFGNDIPHVLDLLSKSPLSHLVFEKVYTVVTPRRIMDAADRGVHLYFTDDYEYWNKNGRQREYGKQIIGHPHIQQFGFDDNLCMFGDTSVQIDKVNTYLAATQINYFTNFIE